MASQETKTKKQQDTNNDKFTIELQNEHQILLDNKEWLWQAKLLGYGEVLVIIPLCSLEHTKWAIDYLSILQKWEKYMTETDVFIEEQTQNEIKDFLLSLSN